MHDPVGLSRICCARTDPNAKGIFLRPVAVTVSVAALVTLPLLLVYSTSTDRAVPPVSQVMMTPQTYPSPPGSSSQGVGSL